jgi:hypothetical protein
MPLTLFSLLPINLDCLRLDLLHITVFVSLCRFAAAACRKLLIEWDFFAFELIKCLILNNKMVVAYRLQYSV